MAYALVQNQDQTLVYRLNSYLKKSIERHSKNIVILHKGNNGSSEVSFRFVDTDSEKKSRWSCWLKAKDIQGRDKARLDWEIQQCLIDLRPPA